MSSPNAFISNGTCYSGPGEVTPFFPCGNDVFGHKSCCQSGDMCLSSNACYNSRFGVTYLAGCSDPEYADESCPEKGAFDDQPWAGLVYCNGTSEQWVACEQAAAQTTITVADACFCPETSRTVAFTDASVLTNVVSLPTALGGSVIWQPGYVPTPTNPSTTSTSASSTSVSFSSATPTSTPTPSTTPPPSSSDQSGLSSSAKIGIGVGVGVGGAILLAVLAFLFLSRRRRQKSAVAELDSSKPEDGTPHTDAAVPAGPRTPVTPATVISELEPTVARPRSELDGTPRVTPVGATRGDDGVKIQDRLHPDSAGHSPLLDQTFAGEKRHTGPVAELPG